MIEQPNLKAVFGFGVAGNFAGHLEQAGEASDFANVQAESEQAPKGIFPFYVPGDAGFLGAFPVSGDALSRPPGEVNLQIEPEAGVLCDVAYDGDRVAGLAPVALGAFNDCSIRREGALKISEKKNWGADSKGYAARLFEVREIEADGATARFRLACFLRRGGEAFAYGADSALPDYSYYGTRLLDWIVGRLNDQQGAPDTPLEPVGEYLSAAGAPETVLVGIGATRYTTFGETQFLEAGDESIVIVYDSVASSPAAVSAAVASGDEDDLVEASVLRQVVYAT